MMLESFYDAGMASMVATVYQNDLARRSACPKNTLSAYQKKFSLNQ